jgi:hypothetical protein
MIRNWRERKATTVTVTAVVPRVTYVESQCQVAKCSKKAITGDLCALHFSKAMQFGDRSLKYVSDEPIRTIAAKPEPQPAEPKAKPMTRETEAKPTCGYLGCDRVVFREREQLCRDHYRAIYPEPVKAKTKVKAKRAVTPQRVCSVEGCDRVHYGVGLCSAHWQRAQKYGDPLGRNTKPCEVEGCLSVAYSGRKKCDQHFAQAVRDPNKPDCAHAECDRSARKTGLCDRHYAQMRATREPLQSRDGSCREAGCTSPILAKRLCRSHWEKAAARDQSAPRCAEDGCEKPARKVGRCASHYEIDRRMKRDADPNAPRCLEADCPRAAVTAGRCRACYRRKLGR